LNISTLHQKKKEKEKHEVLQLFSTDKEKRKNGLKRDKVEIENTEMRVIK